MGSPRRRTTLRAGSLVLLLTGVFTLLLAGCGDSGTPPPVPPDDGGGGGGSGLLQVHEFEYDEATDEYVVQPVGGGDLIRVAEADVQRDLVGSLCSACHLSAKAEVKDSVHWTLASRTPRVLFPGGGAHGMLDRACGLPSTTGLTNSISDVNLGECAKCHVGRYLPMMEGMFANMFGQMGLPDPQGQATRIVEAGMDCLICHSEGYKSHPTEGVLAEIAGTASPDGASPTPTGLARDAHDNTDFDHDGVPDLLIDMDGDGIADAPFMIDTDGDGQPDSPWRTVAQDRSFEALATIGPTTAEKCLRCHDHARTGYKRGTLFTEGHDHHATLTTGQFAGATNQCTVCHTASHHKFVRGHSVGGDLAAADYMPPPPGTAPDPNDPTDLTCLTCHDTGDLTPTIHTSKHLETMSCEMCHIPYASGITYSLFGHGGQLSFARNGDGKDTKLIAADMYLLGDKADQDADYEAFRTRPVFMWFNGGTSFLAQSLAVRGMPNSKITPFKPMANGMVFDGRFFDGKTVKNEAGIDYNAHSMYRFYANGSNAEAFFELDMLDMTPTAVRNVTLDSFFDPDPSVQAMALMLVFPNLVYFDKGNFGYEHYMTATGSPFDTDADGLVDVGAEVAADMYAASNAGLRQFQGFNGPMGFPADYQWYPPFTDVSQPISMKLPDGSLIKMFLQMQAESLPAEQQGRFLDAVANYPSFSQITLGGHGIKSKLEALGAQGSCLDCHGSSGALAQPVPVGRKELVDMGSMGTLEMPLYAWKFYKVSDLIQLGLTTTSEEVIAGTKDLDIDGNTAYLRESDQVFRLNWFAPSDPSGYRRADHTSVLQSVSLQSTDLTWSGGAWMPVLEPVVDMVPNYAVLGYKASEIIWGAPATKAR